MTARVGETMVIAGHSTGIPAEALASALDAVPYGFALVDSDGRLGLANTAMRAMLRVIRPEDVEAGLAGALGGGSLGRTVREICPDGTQGRDIRLPDGSARLELARTADCGWAITLQSSVERCRAEAQAKRAQKVALVALADLAEYRDSDTGEHVLRVARMTHEIARTIKQKGGYPEAADEAFLNHIGIASILHDVGKVGVPDSVLLKPGRLTPEERVVMERHAHTGGAILAKAERMMAGSMHFRLASDISGGHHEYWDGSGYPARLRGEAIPLAARIVAVADVYDALTSKRPYKDPWPEEQAIAYVVERAGTQFDPAVVEAFKEVLTMRARAAELHWSDAIEIGDPVIDHDHRILLALINQVASPENRYDTAAVEFVLDELLNYTNFHFEREEELMAAAGYPDVEAHRAVHRRMVQEVTALQQRFSDAGGGSELGDELSRYLTEWLSKHIMDEDRKYLPYVLKPEGGRGLIPRLTT